MMHLDEQREVRVTHHIRAIETLLGQEVVMLVLRSRAETAELVIPCQAPAQARIRILLSTVQTALAAAVGELGLEST